MYNSTANQDIAEQDAANQEAQTATKMAQEVEAVFNEARQDYKAGNYESAEMRLKSLEDLTLPFLQKSLDEIRKQVASYSSLNLMMRFPQYLGYWQKAASEVQAFLGYNAEYRHKIFELRDLIAEARKYDGSSYKKQQEEERLRKEKEARAEQERIRKEQEFRAEQERIRKEQEFRAEQERLRKEQEARAEQERIRKEQEFRAEQERIRKAQEEYQRRYEEQERIRKAQEEQARREKARQEEARKSSSSSSNTGYGSYSYSEPKPQYEQPQYNPEADAQPKSGDVRTNNGKKERWNGSRWVRM